MGKEVAGVQELQELQNKKAGIVPRKRLIFLQRAVPLGTAWTGAANPKGLSPKKFAVFRKKISLFQSSNPCAHFQESDRTRRDGSFSVTLSQALRARLRAHRPSGDCTKL
jgi:hypothetical protein